MLIAGYLYERKQEKMKYLTTSLFLVNAFLKLCGKDKYDGTKLLTFTTKWPGRIFSLTKLQTTRCTFNPSVETKGKAIAQLAKALLIQREVTQEVYMI